MKSSDDESFMKWNETPEPLDEALDPQTILDMGETHDAYLWNSEACSEEWLAYDGELREVKQ